MCLQFELLCLEFDCLLDKFECLGFVVDLNSSGFGQDCSLWWSHNLLLVNHRRRTVRLGQETRQCWLAPFFVILLLYKLNHFSCVFAVSVLDGRLGDRQLFWNFTNSGLRGFNNHDWRFCGLNCMDLLRGMTSLFNHNLGVFFNHALGCNWILFCCHLKLLEVEFFPILLRHLCTRDAWVDVL